MREKAVLVTGGAGFIGSNLVDLLMERGHTVYVLDDLSSGSLENIEQWLEDPRFRFIRGDIRRPIGESLHQGSLAGGPPVGTLFHLAARVDVTSSFEHPEEDAQVNYMGTMNVLDYALREDIGRVVFASSAAVYGDNGELPVRESSPKSPLSPYGLHKLSSERLLEIYRLQWGIGTVSLRFFNVYGPRQDPSNPYSGVISKFMEKASGSEPFLIYGDGSQTRDFIFVEDVAKIMCLAASSDISGAINLGTGSETTILDLAQTIGSVSGLEIKNVHMPARKGEIQRSRADISLLKGLVEGVELTDLRTGLHRTYDWYKRRVR